MKNRKIYLFIEFMLIGIIIFASFKIYSYHKANKDFEVKNTELIEKVEEFDNKNNINIIEKTEDEKAIEKISYLKSTNDNLVAWIEIPNTTINYPVVQGKDNEFYLNHDYTGKYHVFGAVFLEKDNNSDFTDYNSIIYGHNIRAGKVFHDLEKYRNPNFVNEAPIIEIATENGMNKYEIFAVYEADPLDNFRSPSYDEKNYEDFIRSIGEKNILKEVNLRDINQILTLQTCLDNDIRLVIHAKKI